MKRIARASGGTNNPTKIDSASRIAPRREKNSRNRPIIIRATAFTSDRPFAWPRGCSICPAMHTLPVLVAALVMLGAAPSFAACNSPAAPGADWRRCLLDRRDLTGADLTGAVLRDASLQRATLAGTKLVNVEGPDARFVSADLKKADLSGSNFRGADFTRADMREAVLKQTDLRGARFFGADLRGADLTGADLGGVDLNNARLGGARWVDGERVCAENSMGICQ
ncbi:pentapeptide repeat-containing protein [Elioraea sp.]|uniref:pentapeptide repeat-containing protein n=1 Tax=Elioraea sp. TaxID=2185103 RepID=UPI0025BC66B7|nr:pentapeptide repeat-containing protein [Elioraea sp.]